MGNDIKREPVSEQATVPSNNPSIDLRSEQKPESV